MARASSNKERAVFGEQRLVREDIGILQRAFFRSVGIADPAHFLHNLYLRRALDRRAVAPPRQILDAGCGAGDHSIYLARRFPQAEVLGVDIQEELIERNRIVAGRLGLRNVSFEVADITTFSSKKQFDLITSIDVLEHILDQRRALERLAAHLSPGGAAYLHIPTVRSRPVPLPRWLGAFHEWAEEEHVAMELTPERFADELVTAGFKVVHCERTFGYWTGELATSLFALPYRNSLVNRFFQLLLALPCRGLAWADVLGVDKVRFAVGVLVEGR